MAETGRRLVREQYTVQAMAAEHMALYEELLVRRRVGWQKASTHPQPASVDVQPFRRPSSDQRPLVSVIVPCFNHGRYLRGCLQSVHAQSYQPIETIELREHRFEGTHLTG